MKKNLFYLVGLFTLTWMLSSCGYHLRGSLPLAPALKTLYIQSSDPYGDLVRNLSQFLKISGVKLVDRPQDATTVLVIINETSSQQLLSISGTQQQRQYNLILTVTYQITKPNGTPIVGAQTNTEVRALSIKADQILAGSNEATRIFQQMRLAIVNDIMSRLSSKEITLMLTQPDAKTP